MAATPATSSSLRHQGAARALIAVGIATFGYAAFNLGGVDSRSLHEAVSAGHYPLQELLIGILTDPQLFVMLLLIRALPWAWEVVPLVSPARMLRAGSFSSVVRRVLLPAAVAQSILTWLLVYAVAGLVVAGGWLATGLQPAQASVSLVSVLSSQFARGVLVFVLTKVLLGFAAIASPERFRQRFTAAASVLLWLTLFVLSSMPDLVPAQLNVITILSAGSEQDLPSTQLARPAQLLLGLIACVACAGIVDVLLARARGHSFSLPSRELWLALAGAGLFWALSSKIGPTVAEFYSGYRGALMGAVAEVSLTLGPAVVIWLASRSGSARGWNTAVLLRAGTHAAGLLALLRSAGVTAMRLGGYFAIGTVLGVLALRLNLSAWNGSGESLIVGTALIGGLLQTLVYLVILLTQSFLTRSQWPSIASVIVLVIVPPPGVRVQWLPLHAAFDSLLAQAHPALALRNTLCLAVGLLLTTLIAIAFAALRDRSVRRRVRRSDMRFSRRK